MSDALRHPLLEACGVEHGFGVRDAPEPPHLLRPRQVHGAQVTHGAACAARPPPEADAVLSRRAGERIGVVTADCIPLLLAARGGGSVAAVHAGWRGLARGVVEVAVDALRSLDPESAFVAVLGPCIGPCCYEVDAPVLRALEPRFGSALARASTPTSPGHVRLDLAALARAALRDRGLAADSIGELPDACTRCDAKRFHSYRRDGARAGRLAHFISPREA